ncbi:hypothetical protein TVAG_321210 [Trichomonas vaginalis G3]|uniref:Uncharacterized protein n=1 Tax=Trichomonas vaginalis (strain ATCC PRA-98 / G3) TaxID=412133 RepID=A2F829_TRIV3|nr:armadillo (ARM) repeat-containing protein family [Trichomonas vaginalis G3]EAX98961.1 hypothetical protein TVAG_321210 [Trichomonas vaginalis G3]KAI5533458.1 armadillo (ARM) repeat-containing protein family [Trichomonas vaginalis G3]|eukprot:XP_001311891.1 hypothetical protein [Trichomonas vaginalis G3]
MDLSTVLSFLEARGSGNSEALAAEAEYLQSNPLQYFLGLANVIISDNVDHTLISRAMLSTKTPLQKIRDLNLDTTDTIALIEHQQTGLFQELTQKALNYASEMPNQSGNLLCNILVEFIINSGLNPDNFTAAVEIITTITSYWEKNKIDSLTTSFATAFDNLSDEVFIPDPEMYQPIMSFIISSLYIDTLTQDAQKKILTALLHIMSSIEAILNDEDNRGIILQVIESKVSIPSLKPICYKIYGKIARYAYSHFGDIAANVVLGANQYLSEPNITGVDQCAICNFFKQIARAELSYINNHLETYGIIEQVFPTIFMPIATISASDDSTDLPPENQALTPADEAINVLNIMTRVCPSVTLPIIVEFVQENISVETIGGKVTALGISYAAISLLENEALDDFTSLIIQSIADCLTSEIPRLVYFALITLSEIVNHYIQCKKYDVLLEPLTQMLPVILDYIENNVDSYITEAAIEIVIKMAEQKDKFPYTTDIFNKFIGVFESNDQSFVSTISSFIYIIIQEAANVQDVVNLVPTIVQLVLGTKDNEILKRNSGDIFYLLYIFLQHCFSAFDDHKVALIDALIADYVANQSCDSVNARVVSSIIFAIARDGSIAELQSQYGQIIGDICLYLLQRVGNPTDVSDGCIAIENLIKAKGFISDRLQDIVYTLNAVIPDHKYFPECMMNIVSLVNFLFQTSYSELFAKVGGVEILKLINSFVIEDESFATDSCDLLNNITALYTTLLEKYPENCLQWVDPMIAIMHKFSPAIDCAESDDYRDSFLVQICSFLKGFSEVFRDDGVNALRDALTNDEKFLAVIHMFFEVDRIASDARILFNQLEIPIPNEEEELGE